MFQAKFKEKIKKLTIYLLIVVVILIFFIPLFWIIVTSLKYPVDVFSFSWLFQPTLRNYSSLLSGKQFKLYYLNSGIVSLGSILLILVLSLPAAYALARFKIPRKEDIAFWILSLRMIPPIVVVIPIFLMFKKAGLYDKCLGLILIYVAFNLPFAIWMLKGFIEEIPIEIEEAALIDGCSSFGVFLKVTLPISFTATVATTVLCFIFIWNEFLFASVLTGMHRKTLSVAIYNFIGFYEISWARMCAAAILISIPVITIGIIVRKYLIRGLTFGALKG